MLIGVRPYGVCRRPACSSTEASYSAPTSWLGLKGGVLLPQHGRQVVCPPVLNAPQVEPTHPLL